MKLEYTVLWFDNSQELFDSLSNEIDYLKQSISEWGFIPKVLLVTTGSEFMKHAPFTEIDLVVVDFNLEEHGEGKDFIRKVRDSDVFSEVIFYSAQAAEELWEAIKEKKLEGVYVANKDNIVSKILGVGEFTLRKVLDLENMRGIVMAEVGDLDRLLEEIFSLAMNGIPADKQKIIYKKFHDDVSNSFSQRKDALNDFISNPSVEKLLSFVDSDKRWSNYQRVEKQHDILRNRNFVGDYRKDILKPRNFLAHGIPSIQEDGARIFEHNGQNFMFDEHVSRALRGKIIQYKHAFQEMRNILNT